MTLFPEMCETVLNESIIGRARKKGVLDIHTHQIRDYTKNRQKQVDDYPYGGGMGMVMTTQPIADCFRAVCEMAGTRPRLIYMSPQGQVLTQKKAQELAKLPAICILCGHYEGVDQRVIDAFVDEDFNRRLCGYRRRTAALVLIDCVARMVPGFCRTNSASPRKAITRPANIRTTHAPQNGAGLCRNPADRKPCENRAVASRTGVKAHLYPAPGPPRTRRP